jgi:hypothetical protein
MSNPVSNVEIEDVLSSIRRLVSADQRDRPAATADHRGPAADRLVLTPALRVTDPAPLVLTNPQVTEPLVLGDAILPDARGQGGADPSGVSGTISRDEAPMAADVPHGAPPPPLVLGADPAGAASAPVDKAPPPEHSAGRLTEMSEPEFSAALVEALSREDPLAGQAAEEGPDPAAPVVPAASVAPAGGDARAGTRAAGIAGITTQSILSKLVEDEVSRALGKDFSAAFDAGTDAADADVAPADVAPADVGPGPGENRDPDAPGPLQGLGRAGHLLLVPAARAPVDEAYEDEDYDEYDLSDLQDIRPLSLRRDALQDDALSQASDPSATDLTPESDVAGRDDTWRDDAGRDAFSEAQAEALSLEDKISRLESLIGAGQGAPETGTAFFHRSATLDWEDAAPRQAVQDSAAAPADHLQQEVPTAPLSLDDAVLRDLVAGIIREELKGVLGERITRNVRKLVRREINRMLVSQDFD